LNKARSTPVSSKCTAATGNEIARSLFSGVYARVYSQAGQVGEGWSAVQQALDAVEASGRRDYEAELYRLKGVLLLQQAVPDAAQAEACFRQALVLSRQQQAKSLELRAAISLARLWQSQGKRQDAYDLLAPVYGWFTEGFDTADLIDAKALLNELA
jgi:predicted ATPase